MHSYFCNYFQIRMNLLKRKKKIRIGVEREWVRHSWMKIRSSSSQSSHYTEYTWLEVGVQNQDSRNQGYENKSEWGTNEVRLLTIISKFSISHYFMCISEKHTDFFYSPVFDLWMFKDIKTMRPMKNCIYKW